MENRYQDLIKDMTEKELLFHLYATQIILLTISYILGMMFYRDIWFFMSFFDWDDHKIFSIGVTSGFLVVIIDVILMKILPKSYYDDGGLNEKIFRNRNFFHIAFIAFIVAFSEELLFRGIIQTKVGLIIASLIFAIIHYRYLFNWYLFMNIIVLSFFIGYLYQWTGNLAVTFVMHFIIDFLLGLLLMKKTAFINKN
ncbi:MAG TPA: type II CAAX endopeptidase family protein [Pseudoneobacillus sp.]|nr:type II CAAX endopeptidase family protein [Pseudoneobacillus sp.]